MFFCAATCLSVNQLVEKSHHIVLNPGCVVIINCVPISEILLSIRMCHLSFHPQSLLLVHFFGLLLCHLTIDYVSS